MSSALDGLTTRRLWSLWDMLKFHAKEFVGALNAINILEHVIDREEIKGALDSSEGRLTLASIVSESTSDLEGQLLRIGLPFAAKAVERLTQDLARTNIDSRAIKNDIRDIRTRMRDELENVLFFTVSKHKSKLEPKSPPFGSDVNDKFPSAADDIEEAGKCLALERSTACVFHLMRALEIGLRALAAELGVSVVIENWNTLLNDIEKEIRGRKSQGANANWAPDDETYFSDAATSFFSFKNAWRNHTMHKRASYSPEKAEEIYVAVRTFLKHLSIRIKELPSP